jgi:ActR/RegA family two-component response regulator
MEALAVESVDVVLLDLNLPDSRGLDTLESLRSEAPSLPIIVLTGVADRDVGIRALKEGAEEFLVKDEINARLLVRTVFHALERARYERELEVQHDKLAALNQLNKIIQDINHALVEQSSRREIERIACERLVGPTGYRFAWIGAVDIATREVTERYRAGIEDDSDDVGSTGDVEWTDLEAIERAIEEDVLGYHEVNDFIADFQRDGIEGLPFDMHR